MSVQNVKSTLISNRDATPKVLTDGYVAGGTYAKAYGYVQTVGSSDSATSTYRMCEVPSNARVDSVDIQTDSLGSGCTLNVGVYWPTYIPVGAGILPSVASTVINTTLFASAFAASNINAITNITNQSGVNTIKNQELPIWSACGLASDPGFPLDIVVEVAGAVATQGYIGLKVGYQF